MNYLELAEEIARETGEMLLAERGAKPVIAATKSSPTDVVTELDQAAEKLIRSRLPAGHAVLGEEEGASGGGAVRWIVDPIDGTVNFLYGLPDWAVSIAVEVEGTVVAGVVYNVPRGELFTATLDGGAWLDGERLGVSRGVPLERALVATGFGYFAGRRAVQAEVVAEVLPRVRDIRRSGSCAVDLSSLAAGRVDAYYERGAELWDHAAGGLIAREAGARFGGLHGRPASREMALGAAPELFGELHDLLASLDPERDL